MTLAATLTGCTTALSPTGRPGWNAESVREADQEYASLCADPAGMPGPAGGVPPVAPAVARTGEVPVFAGQTDPGEGDELPMPAVPVGTVLAFCVYGPPPASAPPAQVPESPSCPAGQVSAVQPGPGVAWAVAADGTPRPFPYPQIGAPGEGDCAPVVDDVQARLWR
ncbi:hypothetical protein M878_08620 [Streptomyces roseochromogenus subsp. oscitans DS 12.976]|uniref:Uncharacterized protein n=2 Tax=Streptomyces roseochromogenus TaxID=285450 RepID=V6KSB6_STRRC|nr:hypothetical protein M878_08620 [Streptomyces roseochromogenus subsp. oscitans DS 12.976]